MFITGFVFVIFLVGINGLQQIDPVTKKELMKNAEKLIPDFNFFLKAVPPSEWKPHKSLMYKDDEGNTKGRVYTLQDKRGGIVILLKMIADVPVQYIYETISNYDNIRNWNSQAEQTETIWADDTGMTTLRYLRTAPLAKGRVKARKFIELYQTEITPSKQYTVAYRSIDFPFEGKDPNDKRGETYLSGYRFKESKAFPGSTEFTLLEHSNMDLSFLPKSLVNQLKPSGVLNFVKEMVTEAKKLQKTQEAAKDAPSTTPLNVPAGSVILPNLA